MRRFTSASELIGDLLDRLEKYTEPTQLLAYIDYEGFRSIGEEDECITQLLALERAGGVKLKRLRKDGVESIAHVRLADPNVLYAHLNRLPAAQSSAEALSPLRNRRDLPENSGDLFDEVQNAWSRNVSWATLRSGQAGALNKAIDLALALGQLANESTVAAADYRSFSNKVVGDSKLLEKLVVPVVTLLRRLLPELIVDPDLETEDIFASLGVTRLPQPFLASGRVTFEGQDLPDMPYFGIPAECAFLLKPRPAVSYILTIENYTSFVRHAREINREKNGIVIYTSGFPARATLAGILAIAERAQAPVYHWGDIDPGGLRIFRHIEEALSGRGLPLHPHLMSWDLLCSHGRAGREPARRLRPGQASTSCLAQLWDAMAHDPDRLALEQEALEPRSPICLDVVKE
jgi:hypothetical protein